jgi:hypothetical protein
MTRNDRSNGQTAPVPTAPPSQTARALQHVLLAGLLGVLATLALGPFVVGALFGGAGMVVLALLVIAAVVTAAAVGLDRIAGPGALGRDGSLERGLALGVLGTLAVAGLAWVVLQEQIGEGLPIPLRFAMAALPFMALAGLQWPGAVRVVTALVLIGSGAAVAIPNWVGAVHQDRTALLDTEIGTTAHPWVTEVEGFEGESPQATGSELIWTRYRPADGDTEPVLQLFRDLGTTLDFAGDPCAATSWSTPEGDQPMTSCTPAGERLWRRTTDDWQQLLERREHEWVGVTAPLDAPEPLLEEALANGRPMTDDEYDDWLDEYFTSGPGRGAPGW